MDKKRLGEKVVCLISKPFVLFIYFGHEFFVVDDEALVRALADCTLAVCRADLEGELAAVNGDELGGGSDGVIHGRSAVMRDAQADADGAGAIVQMCVDSCAGRLFHESAHCRRSENGERATFHGGSDVGCGYGGGGSADKISC